MRESQVSSTETQVPLSTQCVQSLESDGWDKITRYYVQAPHGCRDPDPQTEWLTTAQMCSLTGRGGGSLLYVSQGEDGRLDGCIPGGSSRELPVRWPFLLLEDSSFPWLLAPSFTQNHSVAYLWSLLLLHISFSDLSFYLSLKRTL